MRGDDEKEEDVDAEEKAMGGEESGEQHDEKHWRP